MASARSAPTNRSPTTPSSAACSRCSRWSDGRAGGGRHLWSSRCLILPTISYCDSNLGGRNVVVRRIRVALEHRDRMKVAFQEQTVGRHKYSGAPLGKKKEFDAPDLGATDANGNPVIPENAHVRLRRRATTVRRSSGDPSYNDGVNFTAERWPLAAGFGIRSRPVLRLLSARSTDWVHQDLRQDVKVRHDEPIRHLCRWWILCLPWRRGRRRVRRTAPIRERTMTANQNDQEEPWREGSDGHGPQAVPTCDGAWLVFVLVLSLGGPALATDLTNIGLTIKDRRFSPSEFHLPAGKAVITSQSLEGSIQGRLWPLMR